MKEHKAATDIITHDEALIVLAVAVGKGMQELDSINARDACLKLGALVTDEDIDRAKVLLKKTMETCACDDCKKTLASILELEATEAEQTDDSFSA